MCNKNALLVFCAAILVPVALLNAQTKAVPTPFGSTPARIVGQVSLEAVQSSVNPNLVEGKELWQPSAVALDTTVTPPALYVSDTLNNRVLGWQNAAAFTNGAPADIAVGQRDLVTTNPAGPGTSLKRGLYYPTGIVVDGQGNLYVVDAANNRILRYPKPFADPQNRTSPDLVIGQTDFDNARSANHGAGATSPDDHGIQPLVGGSPVPQTLVFDAAGNLWFADSGNNRVLRFPKTGDGLKVQVNADVVLGQQNFTSRVALPANSAGFANLSGMLNPTGIAFDAAGHIYVSDFLSRVLVFSTNPPPVAASALRLLGKVYVAPGQQPPQVPNATVFSWPAGLVMIGSNLGVVDAAYNRITFFDPFDSWPADSPTTSSPPARAVLGQTDFTTSKAAAGAGGFRSPMFAAYSGTELFVVDAGNNRLVVFPQGFLTSLVPATRVLGQRGFDWYAANLIEGREIYVFSGYQTLGSSYFVDTGGVVVDATSTPPHLYVADTYNNRVLGFRDARNVKPGDSADLVLGQPDRLSSSINGQANDPTQVIDIGLYLPAGLAVDGAGNLFVADKGNGRVLRFPKPFDQASMFAQHPDLVLGQRSFTEKNTDASQFNMAAPYGLAVMPQEGHLLVSDRSHHRVLMFKKPNGGDFTNGQGAAAVFGQPDFISTSSSQGLPKRMVSPRGIAVDGNGRLYVADTGNNRILVYSQISGVAPGSDPDPLPNPITLVTATTTMRSPNWVYVNKVSGEIWVAEYSVTTGRVLRYPDYSTTQLTGLPDFILPTVTPPLSVTLDSFNNLIVLEVANRLSFYFPPLWTTNSANYLPSVNDTRTYSQPCCAPGALATAWPFSPSGSFGQITGAHAPSVPLPTTLSDVQLVIGGTPAPLLDVLSSQINFQVPKGAATTGTLEATIVRPSTGQVLAAGTVAVRPVSPAMLSNPVFPSGATGKLLIVAQNNNDSPVSCNGVAGTSFDPVYCPGGVRPARRGEVVTLYCNGQGLVDGMPDDGAIASGQPTALTPTVIIGTGSQPAQVQFSGLAPSLVGVWQINVKIPDNASPGAVPIAIVFGDIASSVMGNPATVIQVQ